MSLIDHVRRNPILRALYRLPGIKSFYHWTWAWWGAIAFGFPSRSLTVIGVTGTKGKTTVSEFLAATLRTAGLKTALLSSVHVQIAGKDIPNRTGNSMPGRFFIQRFLSDARAAGCTHAVIEVTSEGVVQKRHRFIEWNVAAITNVAPEHIESHGSYENYRDAKLAFLQYAVSRGATAFVNGDDERSVYFRDNLPPADTVTYSTRALKAWPPAAFAALPGEFNRQNVAAALAIARALRIPDAAVQETAAHFAGVPGRMEFVSREPFQVVVDYAHTPDSMEAAYKTVRASLSARGRIIAVFGSCGGHRDKWKRPVMGEMAARYANLIILTNEDPYDEDPAKIVADIRAGVQQANFPEADLFEALDRREAIRKAFALARAGDAVVMTGKGSEVSIHIERGKTIPWNERREAEEALQELRQN